MTGGFPSAPEPLTENHDLDAFDCGVASLNAWLRERALRNEAESVSRTYVACLEQRVVAYYSLAVTSVEHAMAPGKIRRNMPDPVPAALLGRLAVDRRWQGQRLGLELLQDAVLRVATASASIGIRVLLVHAISPEAESFYEKLGFRRSPVRPATLMVTIDEIRRLLRDRGR